MDPHTAQLASGPYEVQTRLTQIAQAAMPSGLIADDVCPRVRTGFKFTYTTLTEEDLLTIPDVRASRAGRLNQVEFGATDTTASVVDYGLEDPVPSRDIEEARAQEVAYDPLEQAAISTAELVKLARERRVADLVTTASHYAAGHSATLNGNAQWSHASSNPRKAILEALDVPLVRPNVLVFGQKVWTALRQHPKIVEAVAATGAGDQASGIVVKEAVAELFEVDRVLVGMAWYQSAKRGQEDSFARLWGKHACAIHVRRDMASSRDRMPKFCWTADALGGLQVGTYEEPARGVNRGSTVVKVSECVKELVAYSRAGYLWRNAVA